LSSPCDDEDGSGDDAALIYDGFTALIVAVDAYDVYNDDGSGDDAALLEAAVAAFIAAADV
jgi:hypothetical protein